MSTGFWYGPMSAQYALGPFSFRYFFWFRIVVAVVDVASHDLTIYTGWL